MLLRTITIFSIILLFGSFVSISVVDTIALSKNHFEPYSSVSVDGKSNVNDKKLDSVNISENVAITVHYKNVKDDENSGTEKIVVYSTLEQNSLNLLKQNSDTKMTMDRFSNFDRIRLNTKSNFYENNLQGQTSKVKLPNSIKTVDFTSPEMILLSDSWKLDSQRNSSNDIFSKVQLRDNDWTGIILPGDYIRIVFEKNLTKNNDITIFARGNYSNGSIQVYEKDKNHLVAQFGNITREGEYKVLLNGLNDTQNTFDLKVIQNPIDFDYIIDPSFNTNPSTTVTLSESAKVPQKKVIDTVALSEKALRSVSVKDVVALSESASPIMSTLKPVSVTDTVALSEKASRSISVKDVVALSESASPIMSTFKPVSVTDTIALSEKASRSVSVKNVVALSESVKVPQHTVTDTVALSEKASRSVSVKNVVALSESTSSSVSVKDVVALSESVSITMNTFKQISVNDTVALNESTSSSVSVPDVVALSESASPTVSVSNLISVNDTVALSESASPTVSVSNLISVNDTVALSESALPTTSVSNLISVNDTVALSENTSSTSTTMNPIITIMPTNGYPTTTVTVSGSGFLPMSNLEITYGGDVVATTPSPAMVDAVGSFSDITFKIPASSGENTIHVTDDLNNSASTTFTAKNPSGGNSDSSSRLSLSSISFFSSTNPLPNGLPLGSLVTGGNLSKISKIIQPTGLPFQMKLKLTSDNNYGIEHVALYQNLNGFIREISDSNTNIVYEPGKPIQIANVDGILLNANVTTSKQDNAHLDVSFNMIFAKPMKTSDIILRIWDQNKNSRDFRLPNALEVVQVPPMVESNKQNSSKGFVGEDGNQTSNTTSEVNSDNLIIQIKMWAGYSPESISDSELLNYMGISGKHIPAWSMKMAKWVISDEISTQDFVKAINYLKNNGIIT